VGGSRYRVGRKLGTKIAQSVEGKQTHVFVIFVSVLCVVDRRLSDTLHADDGVWGSATVLHGADPWTVQQTGSSYCLEDMSFV
jgi:hypothetical protein